MKQEDMNTVIPPYNGLRYFEMQDAERFFGRDDLVAQLVEHVMSHRFLAVIGASGSGKSSLVRAGLLPALEQVALSAVGAPMQGYVANGKHNGAGLASERVKLGLPVNADVEPVPERLVHIMTPGANPLQALAVALTPDGESAIKRKALAKELTRHPRTLHLYASKLLSDQTSTTTQQILLVVDQFEELFTLCNNPIARRAFVDNLMNAIEHQAMTVVVVLRSDFYAHCAEFDVLRELLEQQQKFIGQMSETQLRHIIEEPARLGGWQVQDGLVEVLLEEAREQEDVLPRLSHALLETWKAREGTQLTFAGYAKTGRFAESIAQQAEALFQAMTIKERTIMRSIFSRLIKIHTPSLSDGADSIRRVTLRELMQSARLYEVSIVERVLHTLQEAGLITINEVTKTSKSVVAPASLIDFDGELPTLDEEIERPASNGDHQQSDEQARADFATSLNDQLNGHDVKTDLTADRLEDPRFWNNDSQLADQDEDLATIEIAHEALTRYWPRLRQWLDEKRDQYRVEHRLTEPARLWALHHRDPGYLYRGSRLAEAENVSDLLHLDGLKREFLEASLVLRNQDEAEQHSARAQTQSAPAVSRWVKWGTIFGIMTLCLLLTVASGFAAWQWYQSQQLLQVTYANDLASQAQAVQEQKPQRSLLLGLEALAAGEKADEPALPAALQALRDGLAHSGGLDMGEPVTGIHTIGTAANVHNPSQPYWLVTGNGNGELGLWQLTYSLTNDFMVNPSKPATRLTGHEDRITVMASNNEWFATGSRDGSIRLWNMASPDIMATSISLLGHEKQVNRLEIVAHWLISDSDDNTVRLWDMRQPQPTSIVLVSHQDYVGTTFAPDGRGEHPYLMTSTAYDVYLWNLLLDDPSQQAPVKIGSHPDRISSIGLSDDTRWLISGSNDSSVRLWNLSDPLLRTGKVEPRYLQAHNNQIRAVGISSDNHWAFTTGGQDAFLWDLTDPEMTTKPIHLPGHKDEIRQAMVSVDSHWLVTVSSRKAVLWDLHKMPVEGRTPIELQGYQDRVSSVAISPDSRWLAVGSYDNSAYVWDLQAPSLGNSAYRLQGHDEPIDAIVTSADYWLITQSRGGDARLWDLREPVDRQLNYLSFQDAEFSENRVQTSAGHSLISNEDAPPPLTKLSTEQLTTLACKIAARNFTQAEWETYFAAQGMGYRKTCPDLPVHPTVIEHLLAEATVLAKINQIDDATAHFEKAIALDADSVAILSQGAFDPEIKARQIASQALIDEGERLAHKGDVGGALNSYKQAQEVYPEINITGPSWNSLCRFGSAWGHAEKVMYACENAVALDPTNGLARNSRALARALTGDMPGAIQDFEFFIEWAKDEAPYAHYVPLREGWIEAMQAGDNPFDDETVMRLRYE